MITQEELKKIVSYDIDTGRFTWINSKKKTLNGTLTGSLTEQGYRQIQLSKKTYKEHRLAFLYMTGSMPINQVDHINGNKTDNRWINLRDVTQSENQRNRKISSNNSTGAIGVYETKCGFKASIFFNKESIELGRFPTYEEAYAARQAGERILKYHENHGRKQ